MEQLQFIGFKDFFKRRNYIKSNYEKLPPKMKYYFKWYLYANPLIKEEIKDIMWEWLHNDISNNELKHCYRKVAA